MQRLKIHPAGRYLMTEGGQPFFYLGDTAWDIFQNLTREEIDFYFSERAKQGFTVIQCILFNGTEPLEWDNKKGRHALLAPYDTFAYDPEWWSLVDFALERAEKYGLYLGLIPMWNNKYLDPENTLFTGYDPAYAYGKYIGERYAKANNLLWILGGDVEVKPHMEPIFRGLAEGIRAGEGENRHLMTFHPRGISDTVTELGGDRDYLDFLTSQSGHTVGAYEPWRQFDALIPTGKPYLDSEAHYEDHVVNWIPDFPTWGADDIRMGAYSCIFSGACGQTYGNPIVAFFLENQAELAHCPYYVGNVQGDSHKDMEWPKVLHHLGAEQLHHLKNLRLSRSYFDFRPAQELVLNSRDDLLFGRIFAARGEDYAMVYAPLGQEIEVDGSRMNAEFLYASWFDPRTGEECLLGCFPPRKMLFVPPTRGKGQDWVLILEKKTEGWQEMGQPTAEELQ